MKDVSQLEVRQIRIFPSDKIPFPQLAASRIANTLVKRFGGAEVTRGFEGPASAQVAQLLLAGGTLPAENGKPQAIVKLVQVTDRKIVVVVGGPSSVAHQALEVLASFIKEIGHDLGEPLVLTEETSCVVTLDFDWSALIAPSVMQFVRGAGLNRLAEAGGFPPEIRGLTFGIQLTYPHVPEQLRQHGVTLAEKVLRIEPRTGTPLAERRYFTSSPSGSETHIELVRELEAALSQSAPGGSRRRRR